MTSKTGLVLLVAALHLAGCHHVDVSEGDIVLDGYQDSNYVALNGVLGTNVCVIGRLSIDTAGAYFPLQPLERGSLVDFGFSRINTSLSDEFIKQNNMKSERKYRICGALKDTTPFHQCTNNYCKWYELQNATLE
jgi:hypothetical protein